MKISGEETVSEPQWNDAGIDEQSAQKATAARAQTTSLARAAAFALVCAVLLLLVRTQRPNASSLKVSSPGGAASGLASSSTAPTASSIVWENSFESAMQNAQSANKPLMIDFYTDWCGVCKTVDSQTYPDANVIRASQNFVMLRVNAEQRTDLAQRFGVKAYPTFVFLNPKGEVISQEVGGYGPGEFVGLLQSASARAF